MPVPTHDASCQSLTYPTSCWYCQRKIFVFQCSCGSSVLFDELGWPWPRHNCPDWPGDQIPVELRELEPPEPIPPGQHDTRRIDPAAGEERSLLVVVRELNASTNRTEEVGTLGEYGRQLLGLEPGAHYWQITLVDNRVRPNESFTALVSERLAQHLKRHVMVMAEISARGFGDQANWIVTDVNPL